MWKPKSKHLSFWGDDTLLTTTNIYFFFIQTILIPLKFHRGIDSLTFYVIYILVHNENNWSNQSIGESTNISSGDWYNIMIIYALNVYVLVWRLTEASKIITSNSPSITLINLLLEMFVIVVGYIYRWNVNLVIQITVNSDPLQFLCIKCIVIEIVSLISAGDILYLLERLVRTIYFIWVRW